MSILDLLKLATRSFRFRLSRTILTIFGVSVGIGAILFLVSFGNGLQQLLLEKITTDEALLSLDVSPPDSEIIKLDKNSLDAISSIEHIEEISTLSAIPSQMSIGELNADVMVNAIDPSYFRLSGIIPIKGNIFTEQELSKIVVAKALLIAFDISPEEALGKEAKFTFFIQKSQQDSEDGVSEVEIYEKDTFYQITGILDEEIIPFVYLPISSLSDLPISTYSQLKVKVEKEEYMESVRDSILSKGFLVFSLSETVEQANKIFQIIQIVLFIFGIISLIVAAIGLINTMTITLLERTNEIGIMRAIGASSGQIQKMFLTESTMMGLFGGIGGVVVGFTAGELFNFGVNILARTLEAQPLDLFVYPVWFIIFIILLSGGVGFIGGIWPARRAAKLDPLEALRYK